MMIERFLNAVILGTLLGSGAVIAAPMAGQDGVLTDERGMSLYVFDKDQGTPGKSACNGPCAANWPPLLASADDGANGDYSMIVRDDGSKQWAYKGRPLYLWVKDAKPGDQTGDGVKGVWHTAKE